MAAEIPSERPDLVQPTGQGARARPDGASLDNSASKSGLPIGPNGKEYRNVIAFRWDSPRVSSSVRIVDEGVTLGSGAEGIVKRVQVYSDKAPERAVPLASKVFHPEELPDIDYEKLFQNYGLAKDAGLPIPRTFRARDDREGILLTDLTENGKNMVFSGHEITAKTIETVYEQNRVVIDRFSESPSVQSSDTNQLTQKATDAQLQLYDDTWFVVVKPDGTSEFIVGDFSNVKDADYIKEIYGDIDLNRIGKFTNRHLQRVKDKASLVQLYKKHPEVVMAMLEIDEISGDN